MCGRSALLKKKEIKKLCLLYVLNILGFKQLLKLKIPELSLIVSIKESMIF